MKVLFFILLIFLFSGCSTTSKDKQNTKAAIEDRTSASASSQSGEVSSAGYRESDEVAQSELSDSQKYHSQALNDPNSVLSIRTVYFTFDSSEINDESREILKEHAHFLGLNPAIQVVLEGHTDERGTRDYNLALGERRAKAVHEFLVSQGVNSVQLEPVSYGEESPVALENNEPAWQLNRRVELSYPIQ